MTLSIRARLTAWYSGVVVVVLIAVALIVALLQDRVARRNLDDELARLMLTLQGVMHTEFSEGLTLQASADEASIEVVAPDRVLTLIAGDGRLLARWGSPVASAWRPPQVNSRTLETVSIDGSPGRLLTEPVEDRGHRYVASVWAPLEGLQRQQGGLRRTLALSVLLGLAIAAVGGWIIARQSLRPLGEMAAQAHAIAEDNPVGRLHAPHSADELGVLARSFNGLLDRLAGVLHAQRQFMADASHELRTPVSVVRSTAQVTLARDGRSADEYRDALTIVGEQGDRLTRLVDAMFLLSRAEARGLPLVREHVYLDDIVDECARALRVLASERHVQIETARRDEAMFTGDDRLLRQMVTNLVDNAIRHARTTVGVAVTASDGNIEIAVSDDGRGVPPADRERIFQRFVRLDSSYSGAGLGLPIAKWIAEAHNGRLILRSSDASGTAFVVTLPR